MNRDADAMNVGRDRFLRPTMSNAILILYTNNNYGLAVLTFSPANFYSV